MRRLILGLLLLALYTGSSAQALPKNQAKPRSNQQRMVNQTISKSQCMLAYNIAYDMLGRKTLGLRRITDEEVAWALSYEKLVTQGKKVCAPIPASLVQLGLELDPAMRRRLSQPRSSKRTSTKQRSQRYRRRPVHRRKPAARPQQRRAIYVTAQGYPVSKIARWSHHNEAVINARKNVIRACRQKGGRVKNWDRDIVYWQTRMPNSTRFSSDVKARAVCWVAIKRK